MGPVEGRANDVVAVDSASSLLALRLRDVAKVSPVGAIIEAFQVIEEEIQYLLLTADVRPERKAGALSAFRVVYEMQLLPDYSLNLLNRLRQLRNIAVHAVEPIDTTKALEFLSLSDEAIRIIRPIRQDRELVQAVKEVHDKEYKSSDS